MHKSFFLCWVLLSYGVVTAQINSGQIEYRVEAPKEFNDFIDSITIKRASKPVQKELERIYHQLKKEAPFARFHMDFNQEASLFQVEENMDVDNGMNIDRAVGAMGSRGIFYINTPEKKSIRQKKEYGKTWRIERQTNALKWEVKNEHKTIQGYKCQKAIATYPISLGRSIKLIAWFTPELPFHFGPNGISGLPGAILGLDHNGYYFYAERINLSKKEKKIEAPARGQLVAFKDFDEIILENDPRAKEKYMKDQKKKQKQ